MIRNIIKSNNISSENIYVFDTDKIKMNTLKIETKINIMKSVSEVIKESNIIILAVKPNVVEHVLESCKNLFDKNKILVSIVVGVPIKFYKNIIGQDKKVIRTMPNTPALVGEGMTLISYENEITKNDLENVITLFELFGKVELLEEKLMSEVTALTGSSPAYVFMFIEAMADAAVMSGIPRETDTHPAELKDQVCSPNGTTISAVASLEKTGFRSSIIEAMSECTKKAKEINKMFEK